MTTTTALTEAEAASTSSDNPVGRIPAVLRLLAAEQGVSLAAVAQEAGISRNTFKRRMENPTEFHFSELIPIAMVLEVDLSEILLTAEEAAA